MAACRLQRKPCQQTIAEWFLNDCGSTKTNGIHLASQNNVNDAMNQSKLDGKHATRAKRGKGMGNWCHSRFTSCLLMFTLFRQNQHPYRLALEFFFGSMNI